MIAANNKKTFSGFTLIELMIAMLIGLIMMLGLVKVFTNVASMNISQNGLARLQENARFLMMRIKNDVEAIGYQPCASISMDSPTLINEGFVLKPLYAAVDLEDGLPVNGLIDPQYLMQGHECGTDGDCQPNLDIFPGGNAAANIPAAGTAVGNRAFATDVLTMRVLTTQGVLVDDTSEASTDTLINLAVPPNQAPLNFESGDKVLIANCYKAVIALAQSSGGNKLAIPAAAVDPAASVSWASKNSMTQVFNASKGFDTVSYYVAFKEDPSDQTHPISTLYRTVNEETPTEVVEGVERFDVFYGVKFKNGTVAYLTAEEVQSNNTLNCVAPPLVPADLGLPPMTNNLGCLWRSVFAVRIHVLVNTVYNSTTDGAETFVYSVDGNQDQLPENIPSGVTTRKMFRREFSETIALNSLNL